MRRLGIRLLLALGIVAAAACAKAPPEVAPNLYVADSQSKNPPADAIQEIEPTFDGRLHEIDADYDVQPHAGMSLAELIDVALSNNPSTRIAWANARAAAAQWGSSRSEYYPTVGGEVEAVMGRVRYPQFRGGRSYIAVGVGLDYLLLDFGGREARVEAARQALMAANWSHDQSIQDVLRDVPQAYYTYLGDRAQVTAAQANLRDAQTTLNATQARHTSGVATISDVLQAKSSASQATADLAGRSGSAEIAKGNLAAAVGWPANTSFGIAEEPSRLPLGKLVQGVDSLVEEAKQSRPDIGAAQAMVRQKMAEVEDARTMPFPKLSATGQFQYQQFRNSSASAAYGGLTLQIPLFAGFAMENTLRAAKAELEAAKAQLTNTQQDVIKQVWDAYHNFKSEGEQYRAYRDLVSSAQESYNASLTRYKNGAADIVELLNAQNTLASARSELIDTRMSLYSTYAELMHAVGRQMSRYIQE